MFDLDVPDVRLGICRLGEAPRLENIVERFRFETVDQEERLVVREVLKRRRDVAERLPVDLPDVESSVRWC